MLLSSWGSNLRTQTPGRPPSGVLRDKGAFLNKLLGKEQKDMTQNREQWAGREGRGGQGEEVCSETVAVAGKSARLAGRRRKEASNLGHFLRFRAT